MRRAGSNNWSKSLRHFIAQTIRRWLMLLQLDRHGKQVVEVNKYTLADGRWNPIMWEHFKKKFLEHFFPQTFCESRARQLADLTLRTRTIDQYATKFMDLSCFTNFLIPNEEKKAEKFKFSLDCRIGERVHTLNIRDFTELVTRVTIAKEDIQESIDYNNQMKHQQHQPTSHRDKRPSRDNGQRPWQGETRWLPMCEKCGKRHVGKCLMGTIKCRQEGHHIRDCPRKNPFTTQATRDRQRNVVPAWVFSLAQLPDPDLPANEDT